MAEQAKPQTGTESTQPVAQQPVIENEPVEPKQDDPEQEEPEEDIKSRKVTLADLSAKGTALYAHKRYEEAADILSTASVLQAEINGETASENAELLFHYGRSLFQVGLSKSDVLGGQAATDKNAQTTTKSKANGKPKQSSTGTESAKTEAAKVTQEGVGIIAEAVGAGSAEPSDITGAGAAPGAISDTKKSLFQFTGDENFVDSDDEVCHSSPQKYAPWS
jgi:HAT1-interacting factor 1